MNGTNNEPSLEQLAQVFYKPWPSGLTDSQVAALLIRGALFTLERDHSDQAVETLKAGARANLPTTTTNLIVSSLGRLAMAGNLTAGNALYQLAVEDHLSAATQWIKEHSIQTSNADIQRVFFLLSENFQAFRQSDPDLSALTHFFLSNAQPELQERILKASVAAGLSAWKTIVSVAWQPNEDHFTNLYDQFPMFRESERQLTVQVLEGLGLAQNTLARDLLCRLFIEYEYVPAKTSALANGFTPSSTNQAALFYFLAEQWQMYDVLDFNQTILARAYENASDNLRKRILLLSRYSGHIDWMEGLSTSSRSRWLWDLNDADWKLAIDRLMESKNYLNLWKLAQAAPPFWGQQILVALTTSGWMPPVTDEKEGFLRLVDLAASLVDIQPPVSLIQTWPSPSPDISCMALNHDSSYLAVGGSNSTVHLWSIYKTPSPLPPIISPVPQTRAIAFSPDGEYLTAAGGDHAIRVFRLSDGKLVKTIEGHTSLVRSLVFLPDGRSLVSAGFDGTLRVWRFPQGQELKRIDLSKSELFGIATSPDGQILLAGGSEQVLYTLRWPNGDVSWKLPGHNSTITSLVSVPRGQLAATAARDGAIILWNYVAGRPVVQLNTGELITVLYFHPNEQFILGASAQGNITIWNVSTGKQIETLSAHHSLITGIEVSPDGQFLFSAAVDGAISMWDLQLFTWSRTPIGSHRSQLLTLMEQRLKQAAQKPVERGWLLFITELIRWRQRFDVEIEDPHQVISIGEFDIEL